VLRDTPPVAVVVIGKNEVRNLDRCFRSIREMDYPPEQIDLIYVDSGSTDGSPQVAVRWGARVIQVPGTSHTAARGRQTGWRASAAPFILFLDGDCAVDPGFLCQALDEFRDQKVAAVHGVLREAFPKRSLLQDLLALQYHGLEEGPCFLIGGNHVFRRRALEAAGGYVTDLESGENLELGRRLRRYGFHAVHRHIPMAAHESKITSPAQWFRRGVRFGYGDLNFVLTAPGAWWGFHQHIELRPRIIDPLLLLLVLVASVASLAAWGWSALPLLAGLMALLVLGKAWSSRSKPCGIDMLLLYALVSQLFAATLLIGEFCWVVDRLRGGTREFDCLNRSRFRRSQI